MTNAGLLNEPLATALASHFFQWFHLEPEGPVPPTGPATIGFRPTGERFNALVQLRVTLTPVGLIQTLRLTLSRQFIDAAADNPFARDIAKSLLEAAFSLKRHRTFRQFHAELADFAVGGAVLMHASAPPMRPSGPPSVAYAVFCGEADDAVLTSEDLIVRSQNTQDGDRPVWCLTISTTK